MSITKNTKIMSIFRKHPLRTGIRLAVAGTLVAGSFFGAAQAADTSDFTQTISAGTLTTDIRDSSRNAVASPAVAFSAVTFSFDCQAGGSASTGTFGTSDERLYVDNPDAADGGWTLAVAATSGASATWSDGGTNTYDFNDPSGSTAGCDDGADGDSVAGQLTLDPTAGSITTDYSGSDTTGITLGSSTAFNEGTTDSVTLINAGASSADIWRGYLTGVSASQTIPAEQAAAGYTLNMTLTATAS